MKNESKIHHLFSYPVYASNIGVDKNFFNDVMLKENFIEMGSKNGYFTDNQNILHKDNYSFLKNLSPFFFCCIKVANDQPWYFAREIFNIVITY